MTPFSGTARAARSRSNVDAVRVPYSSDSQERLQYVARSFRESGTYDTYRPNPKGKHPEDWWVMQPIMPSSKERLGYPTQKPLKLLERIIKASTNPGDMVLDPFCGCATTCVAAETLGREWAGIDLSPLAVKLVGQRLYDHHGAFGQIVSRTDPPSRTDLGELPNYRTHRHTLYGRQEGICNGCLVLFPFRNLTVDHIVPQSKGGSDHPDNLQLLCGACNSKKGRANDGSADRRPASCTDSTRDATTEDQTMTDKPERKKGLKADYKGATPEQVAKALHRHRPEKVEKRDAQAGKPPGKSS